jgi:DNA-binding response OmpR family regulator
MRAHEKVKSGLAAVQGRDLDGRPVIMISGIHQDTRYMLRVLLQMWDYRVIEAEGPDETLKLANQEHPRVILLDTSLLFEDDLEVLRKIRSSHEVQSLPVIMLSGFPQMQYREAAFKNGASGLLVKPLDIDLLEGYLYDCINP